MEAQMLSIRHTGHCVFQPPLTLSCRGVVCHSAGSKCCLPPPAYTGYTRRFWQIYRPTDFLSCGDMGVRVVHRSTDFYIVTKNESWGAYYIRWIAYYIRSFTGCRLHTPVTMATHQEMENQEKSGNFTFVREKSGELSFACAVLLQLR